MHSSEVTKWLRIFSINYQHSPIPQPQGDFNGINLTHCIINTQIQDVSYFIMFAPNSHWILNLHDLRFCRSFRWWLLTHWGRVTHICVSKLTIIGSDNGLSPGRHQAIIWINARILLIEPLGTNFSEILIEIKTFSFKKMHLKMSSGKWQPSCLGLNVLNDSLDMNDFVTLVLF